MFDDMYGASERPRSSTMAGAALFCGIASIIFCSAFYLALPCGALAVIFAILSRIDGGMTGKGKAGVVCGCCGIAASVTVTVFAVHYVLTDPQMRTYVEQYIQTYTGDFDFDLEEQLGELLPFLSDDNSDEAAAPSDDSGSDAPADDSPSSDEPSDDAPTIRDGERTYL